MNYHYYKAKQQKIQISELTLNKTAENSKSPIILQAILLQWYMILHPRGITCDTLDSLSTSDDTLYILSLL